MTETKLFTYKCLFTKITLMLPWINDFSFLSIEGWKFWLDLADEFLWYWLTNCGCRIFSFTQPSNVWCMLLAWTRPWENNNISHFFYNFTFFSNKGSSLNIGFIENNAVMLDKLFFSAQQRCCVSGHISHVLVAIKFFTFW